MNDGNELNRSVRCYIWALAAATSFLGLVLTARSNTEPTSTQWVFAVLLGGAIGMAQQFPVHLSLKTKVYVDTAFITAAALMLPPPLAVLTAAVPTAVHELKQRVSWEQGVFNVAQTACYVLAGSWIVHALIGTERIPAVAEAHTYLAIAAALLVMHVINTLAVAVVVALQLGKPPVAVWQEGLWVDLPEHLALVANGVLIALLGGSYPWLLPLFVGPLVLIYLSLLRSANLRQVSQATIEAIADLTDLLAGESPGHARRVAELTRTLAVQLGVPKQEIDVAVRAAQLHDVGILQGDPSRIAVAPVATFPASHAHGLLLKRLGIAETIRHQRERWDGSGRPDGQTREEIPLSARLLAVADAYDRMIAPSNPDSGLSQSAAVDALERGAGRAWDPIVVDTLTKMLGYKAATTR
jgi:HD-GYP domain-containing protein (c-di-GMP phosphodiesterase class II)